MSIIEIRFPTPGKEKLVPIIFDPVAVLHLSYWAGLTADVEGGLVLLLNVSGLFEETERKQVSIRKSLAIVMD